jgi:hypothetical protein
MLDKAKVFWVAFGVAYFALLVYGWAYERPGAFPTLWWVLAYLALIGFWSGVGAGVLLGLLIVAQRWSQMTARVAEGLTSIGNWFRT